MALDPTLVNLIVFGSVAALSSTGLTMTYLTTRVPNFAHGAFVTIGAYFSVYSLQVFEQSPYTYLAPAFLAVALIALAQYKLVLRPLMRRGTSIVGLMVATITVDVFLFGVLNIIADWATRTFKVQTSFVLLRRGDFVLADIPGVAVVSGLLLVLVPLALYILLEMTRVGTAMRAAIENPSLAGSVGINVDLMYSVAWVISGGLGGVAGLLFGLWLPVNTNSGAEFIPVIFASSILGGLGSIFGAVFGGLIVGTSTVVIPLGIARLGLVEVIQFRPIIPLLIMTAVLLTFPKGITGIRISGLRRRFRWP